MRRVIPPFSMDDVWYTYVYNKTLAANDDLEGEKLSIDNDADFVVHALTGNRTGQYSLRMDVAGTVLQSALAEDANVVGTAERPNWLLHPIYLRKGATVNMRVKDRSAAQNVVQLCFVGRKVPRGLPSDVFRSQWYQLVVRKALTANQAAAPSETLPADSMFVVEKIHGYSSDATERASFNVVTNKGWFKDRAKIPNVAGDAQDPFIMRPPRILPAGSAVEIDMLEQSGGANTVEIVLEGHRLFK